MIYLNSVPRATCLFLPPFFPPQMLCYNDNIDHITMVLKNLQCFPTVLRKLSNILIWHQVPPWSLSFSALQSHSILPSLKLNDPATLIFFPLLFLKIFYLFIHRDRERERQAEGETGFTQGAQCGTWSQVSGITPWTEGGAKLLSHPGCPLSTLKPCYLQP